MRREESGSGRRDVLFGRFGSRVIVKFEDDTSKVMRRENKAEIYKAYRPIGWLSTEKSKKTRGRTMER